MVSCFKTYMNDSPAPPKTLRKADAVKIKSHADFKRHRMVALDVVSKG